MISLTTGLPGHGKTLFTLQHIHRIWKATNRPVFYSGIPIKEDSEVGRSWTKFDDLKKYTEEYFDAHVGKNKIRYNFPPESIIVIDEAQTCFRVRAQGAKVPDHVAGLETHRHYGLDFYFITQHPKLIDTAVRALTEHHRHVVRRFGMSNSVVYLWQQLADPSSETAKKDAQSTRWKHPKEIFEWYKSAEVHTVKRELPVKMLAAFFGVIAVIGLSIWYASSHFGSGSGVVMPESEMLQGALDTHAAPKRELARWDVEAIQPRFADIPMSAPQFDQVTEVVSPPRMEGCMELVIGHAVRCTCHGPGGYWMSEISTEQCSTFVRRGWFDPTKKYTSAKEENLAYLNSRDAGNSSSVGASSPSAAGTAAPAVF